MSVPTKSGIVRLFLHASPNKRNRYARGTKLRSQLARACTVLFEPVLRARHARNNKYQVLVSNQLGFGRPAPRMVRKKMRSKVDLVCMIRTCCEGSPADEQLTFSLCKKIKFVVPRWLFVCVCFLCFLCFFFFVFRVFVSYFIFLTIFVSFLLAYQLRGR